MIVVNKKMIMMIDILIATSLVNNSSLDINELSFKECKLTHHTHDSIEAILSSVYCAGLITFCIYFFCCPEGNADNNEQILALGNN